MTQIQINEMAKSLCNDYNENCHITCNCSHDCFVEDDCRTLYNAGYRKQIEGEWRSELVKRCDWKGKERQYYQPNSCSLCHNATLTRTPYCPKCGAKMKNSDEEM